MSMNIRSSLTTGFGLSKPALATSQKVIRSQRLVLTRRNSLQRPGKHLNFKCKAIAFDPDEYELEEQIYDSDDYGSSTQSTSSSQKSSDKRESKSPPFISYIDTESHHTAAKHASQNPSRTTKAALKDSFNLMLLIGAATDRFVSKIQAAILTAGTAAYALLAASARATRNSFRKSSMGKSIDKLSKNMDEIKHQLPEDAWGKVLWIWDLPPVQRIRLTISMANLSIRLPALLALVATQVGLLASQVSLPMLAPLLLGTGMLMRSIKANASFLFPRIGLLVVVFWLLWFVNSVVQNTVSYLRRQGAIDNRLAGGIITVSECSALLVSLVALLSMLGVNVSALLLPAGVAVAIAAKDLSHNFLAGFFLFVVQPFKLGDRVAISSTAPGSPGSVGGSWFEGVAEKVDLRYTMIRQGKRRLMVPNSAFLVREFMVLEDAPSGDFSPPPPSNDPSATYQEFLTNDYRHVWQYVNGPPIDQQLLEETQQQQQLQQQLQQQQQQPQPPQQRPPSSIPSPTSPQQHQQQQQQLQQQQQMQQNGPVVPYPGPVGGVAPYRPPPPPPAVGGNIAGANVGAGGGYYGYTNAPPPPTASGRPAYMDGLPSSSYVQPPTNAQYPFTTSDGMMPPPPPLNPQQQQQQQQFRNNGGQELW